MRCAECGERLDGDRAEVVRDGKRVVIHAECRREGETVA